MRLRVFRDVEAESMQPAGSNAILATPFEPTNLHETRAGVGEPLVRDGGAEGIRTPDPHNAIASKSVDLLRKTMVSDLIAQLLPKQGIP